MDRRIFALALLLICLVGCGGSQSVATKPIVKNLPYQLKPQTKVLDPAAGVILVSQTKTAIVVSGTVPPLKPGDVIVSQLGKGFVRNVTSVSTSGGQTTINTSQAKLSNAFDQVNVELKAFGKAQLGDIPTKAPGVTAKWITKPKSRTGTIGDSLQLVFDDVTVADNFGMTGTVNIDYNPTFNVHYLAGSYDFGFSPHITGSVQCTIEAAATWKLLNPQWVSFEGPSFTPDPFVPFIEITPVITISSELDGFAAADLTSTLSLDATTSNIAHYRRGVGWTHTKTATHATLGGVDTMKARLGFTFIPIKAEVQFVVSDLFGPYASLEYQFPIEADVTVGTDGKDGIEALITSNLHGQAGISATDELASFLGISTDISTTYDQSLGTIYDKFWPFGGYIIATAGSRSWFEFFVDGKINGTMKQSDSVTVSDLSAGKHTLSVNCIPPSGSGIPPPGVYNTSFDIVGFHGVTFVTSGKTKFRQGMNEGDTFDVDIFVGPDKPPHKLKPAGIRLKGHSANPMN